MLCTFDKQFPYGNQSMSNQDTIELYSHTFYGRDLKQTKWDGSPKKKSIKKKEGRMNKGNVKYKNKHKFHVQVHRAKKFKIKWNSFLSDLYHTMQQRPQHFLR